jgi:hypothetical protein
MKEKIEKLKFLIDNNPIVINEYKNKVLAYMAVVLLGCDFAFLAGFFGKKEEKVRNAVTDFSVKFKRSEKIQGVMFRITEDYKKQQTFNF